MQRFFILAIAVACCSVALADPEAGWEVMFNGKNLTGWKVNEHQDAVRVEDGLIVVQGKRAHAFYMGKDGKADFKNFVMQAEVMTEPQANSGIYFHTKYQDDGWPSKGYECQVNNTQSDPKKTGGLYNVQDNFKAPAKDNEWFKYEIEVQGKHIVVRINDRIISAYTEPKDLDRPERQVDHGTFALQAHDPGSKVYYRNMRVKRLPD